MVDDNTNSIITCNQQPPCHVKYTEDKIYLIGLRAEKSRLPKTFRPEEELS